MSSLVAMSMLLSVACLLLAAPTVAATPEKPMPTTMPFAEPRFVRHDIAEYPGAYQVAVADMNADGKPDVLALSTQANCVDWFENATWRRHPIARTQANIDLAPLDLDGDGRPEIALASEFFFDDGDRGGRIQWLKAAGPEQLWNAQTIAVDPVVHRLRWADLDGDGKKELMHAPIFGPGSKGPAKARPSHLWAFRPPQQLNGPWEKWVIDESLTVLHGIYVGDLDGDGRDEILTASFEGIHRFDFKQNGWQKALVAAGAPPANDVPGSPRGSSEVVSVKLGSKRTILAAIEPWHGHEVVVYLPGAEGWTRRVLDNSLSEGHALVAADFDADGQEEIVAGWRGKGGGLAMFHLAPDGTSFRRIELDKGIAVESAVAADLNGDGKLDIVVGAGRSNKVAWYENQTVVRPEKPN